jgi:hypothetical protein
MSRIARRCRRATPLAALLLALVAFPAAAHEGNPNYRSVVRTIVPPTDGLSAQVLDHDDALLLVNRSGRDVVVLAPGGTPYARLRADGTVQINEHSPAVDAEEAEEAHDHDAGHEDAARPVLAASLDGAFLAHGDEDHGAAEPDQPTHSESGHDVRPEWRTLDRTGRLQWHDGRIKYRAQPVPPQVSDQSEETKVKDWRVPLLVGGQPAAIVGTLTWVGEPGSGSSFPTAAVVSLVVLVLVAIGAVVLVRRRRAAGAQT